jgi:hypothetical protein
MPRKLRLLLTTAGWLMVLSAAVTLFLLAFAWKLLR